MLALGFPQVSLDLWHSFAGLIIPRPRDSETDVPFLTFYGTCLFARQVSKTEFFTSVLAFIVAATKPSL